MAITQRLARRGRGELARLVARRLGHGDGEAELVAIVAHQLRIAGAALAEGDVEADRHVLDAQTADQNVAHEVVVGELGHLQAEGQQIQAVNAHAVEGARQLVRVHQPEGRFARPEMHARMRLEADDAERNAQPLGRLGRVGDDDLVALVHAIETAQRQGRALVGLGQAAPVVNNLQTHQAPRRETMITASPSTTALPATVQTVASVTCALAGSIAVTVTLASTASPMRTGRRKRRLWDR